MKINKKKVRDWRMLYQSGDFTRIAEENECISVYMVSRIFKYESGKIEHINAIDDFYRKRKKRLETIEKPIIDDDFN